MFQLTNLFPNPCPSYRRYVPFVSFHLLTELTESPESKPLWCINVPLVNYCSYALEYVSKQSEDRFWRDAAGLDWSGGGIKGQSNILFIRFLGKKTDTSLISAW